VGFGYRKVEDVQLKLMPPQSALSVGSASVVTSYVCLRHCPVRAASTGPAQVENGAPEIVPSISSRVFVTANDVACVI
jgi:hypothetical protein